jgi:hypothetical protein
MINFEFYNPARIIFGKGEEKNIGSIVKNYGKRVLFHYGGGSIKNNGLYDIVVRSLKESNIEFFELGGVQPNPRISLVRKGVKICKEEKIDFILAVGGGSTIDSAKGIAAGALSDDDIWENYLDVTKPIEKAIPLGVILTMPAAGSESSDSSVVTNENNGLKRYIVSPVLTPKFAVLNPELTFTMPKYQIACGASDMLSHLMERYFTNVQHTDLSDRLIEATARAILINATEALKNPSDYNVRAEIMWAGTLAHNNLFGMGRIGDWASHDIEHEVSGMYDLAHGAGLSIITPAWMKHVYKENINRFVQFAVRVFDVELSFADQDKMVMCMIEKLETWYKSLGLPTRLSEANIGSDKLNEMTTNCFLGRKSIGNLKKLNADDVLEIYKLAV